MTLNAKSTGDIRSKFNPLESGTYPARLLNVIDCGLQAQRPYQGQLKKPQPEILVTYELSRMKRVILMKANLGRSVSISHSIR